MHQDESVSLDDVMCHDLNADPGPARLLWIQMCAVPDRSMSVARSRGRCAPAVACRIVCCTSYVSRRASHVVCCMSYVAFLALHVVRLHVICCMSCVARRTLACHMLHVLRCTSYACMSYVARAARSVLTAHARIQRRHCALAAARRVWRYLSSDEPSGAARSAGRSAAVVQVLAPRAVAVQPAPPAVLREAARSRRVRLFCVEAFAKLCPLPLRGPRGDRMRRTPTGTQRATCSIQLAMCSMRRAAYTSRRTYGVGHTTRARTPCNAQHHHHAPHHTGMACRSSWRSRGASCSSRARTSCSARCKCTRSRTPTG